MKKAEANIQARLAPLLELDPQRSSLPPDRATALTLGYLALPNLIFILGWLKTPIALAIAGLLILALRQYLSHHRVWQRAIPLPGRYLWALLLLALAWCYLGGAGHFVHANKDWHVRDTVLGDLTFSAWPPAYVSSVTDAAPHLLRSAFGFFLPAALMGKLLGIQVVDLCLYLWEVLGVCLFLCLLPLPRDNFLRFGIALLVIVFFSGMDYLGIVLSTGDIPIFPLRLEWWVPFSYSSLSGQLFWAPNHAIPIWLITALFYRHWGHGAFPSLVVVLLPLLVLWTPFAVAGILPFVLLAVLRHWYLGISPRTWQLSLSQILLAGFMTYLMLRLITLDITAIGSAPTVDVAPNRDNFFLKYALFSLMEFGILSLLLVRNSGTDKSLLGISVGILLLLPLYQFGPSNDSMLRLSTPALVFLAIIAIRQVDALMAPLLERSQQRTHSAHILAPALVLVLLIGAATPLFEMWRAATFRRLPPNYGQSLVEQQQGFEPPHYIGRLDRKDLLLLMRRTSLVPSGAVRELPAHLHQ